MANRHWLRFSLALSIGLVLLCSISVAPAIAGRYVLNQPFETLERYFGPPIAPLEYTAAFSPTPIRQLFPSFPQAGEFSITFVNGRAQQIHLMPHASEDEYFTFGQPEAARFFEYIFGYRPPIWQSLQTPLEEGGHEGFRDYDYCLGDGVAIRYIEYRLGADNISLYYNPACEPPYP